MSHHIFYRIKQEKNGDFTCLGKDSNFERGHRPSWWTMYYFRQNYPDETLKQQKARLLMMSVWGGTRFYQSHWKKAQGKARRFRGIWLKHLGLSSRPWDETDAQKEHCIRLLYEYLYPGERQASDAKNGKEDAEDATMTAQTGQLLLFDMQEMATGRQA